MQYGLCCAVRCDICMFSTRYFQIDLIALSLMNNCQETTLECSWHKKIAAVIFFYVMLPVQHSSCQFPLCSVAMFGKTGCRQKAFSSLEPLSLSLFIILHLAALFPFFSVFFFIVNCPNFCFSCPQSARNPYTHFCLPQKNSCEFLVFVDWMSIVHPYKKGKVSNQICHIMI